MDFGLVCYFPVFEFSKILDLGWLERKKTMVFEWKKELPGKWMSGDDFLGRFLGKNLGWLFGHFVIKSTFPIFLWNTLATASLWFQEIKNKLTLPASRVWDAVFRLAGLLFEP